MGEAESTVYSASITTPAGITYSTSVVVPAEAEYDDQHELTETVQAGVARMIGMDARRRPEPLYNEWCGASTVAPLDDDSGLVTSVRCVLPAGHYPERDHEAPRPGTAGLEPGPFRWVERRRPIFGQD